jgi:hypothetical protein
MMMVRPPSFPATTTRYYQDATIFKEQIITHPLAFTDDETVSAVTEKYCSSLLDKYLPHAGYEHLPEDCQRYGSFRANLQRRLSNREEEERAAAIAFQGMTPNEALEAMRAREHGLPHHAQIKRRMTSHNPNKPETSWF